MFLTYWYFKYYKTDLIIFFASSVVQTSSTPGKYVPPHLRNIGDDKRKAELVKLKRNVKGLLNRYVSTQNYN